MDHVSHFIALSQTYSILVQKAKAHESRKERESDEEEKKGRRRRDRSVGVRGWGLQPSVQTRN